MVRPTPGLNADGSQASSQDPADDVCEDEEEEEGCVDPAELLARAAADAAGKTSFWARQVVPLLPWLVVILFVAVVVAIAGWIFWKRFMIPSPDPQVTFRRLAFLGGLSSAGPVDYQTPYQYRSRLEQEFPGQRENLAIIFDDYVGSLYGKKNLADEEEQRLVHAWMGIRLPLLLHFFRRRNL